jgi:hypothetical protein
MVKINLLDIDEERVIYEKGSDLSIKEKPAKEGREFSLESVDELFKTSQTSKQAEPTQQTKPEEPKQPASKIAQTPIDVHEDDYMAGVNEEESFDHFPRGGKLFKVVAIMVLLIAAALVYFFVFAEKGGEKEQPVAEASEESQGAESSPTETTSTVKPELASFYSQNKAKNIYTLNSAQEVMKSSRGNIQIALMVLTEDQIQFSVLADSRDALAAYQTTLEQQFSSTQLRLVESYDMNVSGKTKVGADFILALKGPAAGAPVSNVKTIKSGDLQSTFRALAQKHRLNMQSFNRGQAVRGGQFNQIKFYCNLSGNRDAIINFIKEVTDSYPAISVSKIAINPSGSAGFMARMTLILNEARIS